MNLESKLGSSLDDLIAQQKKEQVKRQKQLQTNKRPTTSANPNAPNNRRTPGNGPKPPKAPGGPPNARRNQHGPLNAAVPVRHGGVQKSRPPNAAPHNLGRRHQDYVDPNSDTNIPVQPTKARPRPHHGTVDFKRHNTTRYPGAHAAHSTPPAGGNGASFTAATRPRPPVPTHVSFRKHNAYRDELYRSTEEPLHTKFDNLHQQGHARPGPAGYPLVNAHGMVVPA